MAHFFFKLKKIFVAALFLCLLAPGVTHAADAYTLVTIFNDVFDASDFTLKVKADSINIGTTEFNQTVSATATVSNVAIGFTAKHISYFSETSSANTCYVKSTGNGATTSSTPLSPGQSFDTDISTTSVSLICAAAETGTIRVYARN